MRSVIVLLLILSVTQSFCQQSTEWLEKLETPEFFGGNLKKKNSLPEYLHHDFSALLIPKTPILGYIGSNYRRIEVQFTSVKKSEPGPDLYHVIGWTMVSGNRCDFEGSIKIEQIREFEQLHYGVDDMYKDDGIKSEGILIGRYQLNENTEQKHVGIFEGIMTVWWYMDRSGQVRYDNLEAHSDRYRNNQYVGTWTEYKSTKGKRRGG